MSNYDFKALDDKEFEAFCADLLGEIEGTRFERFKAGRDGGVDARCLKSNNAEVIVQCKHRPGSSLPKLIALLRDEEKPKVDRLKPARYILCLSNPLSRTDKRKIAEALAPHIATDRDILGAEDLNDELDKYPGVVQRHYKLWLTSAKVLSLMFNKAIIERSASTLSDALEAAKRYVVTTSYTAALNILDAQQVLIVSGEPGVGKTSLAEHIALRHAAEDYEFLEISKDIVEAEKAFEENKPQLFYFDDFLGRNYLEALSGHEGNQIAKFIRRVRKDSSKRFILTSRTTILNQGKMLIDTFEHQNLRRSEYELNLSAYTEMEKARILYSHLWHSELPASYIDKVYQGKRYRDVIGHKNFNPRLISFITDAERVADRPAARYWQYVVETLNNPANIWDHAFNAQLDGFGRLLVLLVALGGRIVSEPTLSEAYSRLISMPQNQSLSGRRDFHQTLRHLTGSFLTRQLAQGGETSALLTLFNPSIADYVYRQFAHDPATLRVAFLSLRSAASLQVLLDLEKNKLIEASVCAGVLHAVLHTAQEAEFVGYSAEYVSIALEKYLHRTTETEHGSSLVSQSLEFVLQEEMPGYFLPLARVVEWGVEEGTVSGDRALRFVTEALDRGADDDDVRQLGRVWAALPEGTLGRSKLEERLKEYVLETLRSNVDESIDETDVFGKLDSFDDESVRERVEELAYALVEDYGLSFDRSEVDGIVDAYDIDRHRESFASDDTMYRSGRSSASTVTRMEVIMDDVDELFDRS